MKQRKTAGPDTPLGKGQRAEKEPVMLGGKDAINIILLNKT